MKGFFLFLFVVVIVRISFPGTIYSYGPFEEVYTKIYELEEHQESFLSDRNRLLQKHLLSMDLTKEMEIPVYLTNLEFLNLSDYILKKPFYNLEKELSEELVTIIRTAGIISLYMETPEKFISGFQNIPDFVSLFYSHVSGDINLNRSFSRYYSLGDVDYFEWLSTFTARLGRETLKLKEKGFNSTINLSLYYSSHEVLLSFSLYYDRERAGGLIVTIINGLERSYN